MTWWTELTPRGSGGVSVVSIQGAGALDAVRQLAADARLAPGRPSLANLRIAGELLDEALVCVRDDQYVELHCHGSPPLVRRIGHCFGGGEARVAAHEVAADANAMTDNQRLAWRRLASAPSDAAARTLLDQAEGALEREIARLADLSESQRAAALGQLEERSRIAHWLMQPPRLLIAGPVNAGKSTLFNALLGRERAITSELAGTTRDLLRETAQLGEWAVQLVDSAGDRELEPGHAVERAGQDLGRRERRAADLTIWLRPPGSPAPPELQAGERRVVIASRGDLGTSDLGSLRPLEDPAGARKQIAETLRSELNLPEHPWVPGASVRLAPLESTTG